MPVHAHACATGALRDTCHGPHGDGLSGCISCFTQVRPAALLVFADTSLPEDEQKANLEKLALIKRFCADLHNALDEKHEVAQIAGNDLMQELGEMCHDVTEMVRAPRVPPCLLQCHHPAM